MSHMTYIPGMDFQTKQLEDNLRPSLQDYLKLNIVFLFRNSIA